MSKVGTFAFLIFVVAVVFVVFGAMDRAQVQPVYAAQDNSEPATVLPNVANAVATASTTGSVDSDTIGDIAIIQTIEDANVENNKTHAETVNNSYAGMEKIARDGFAAVSLVAVSGDVAQTGTVLIICACAAVVVYVLFSKKGDSKS